MKQIELTTNFAKNWKALRKKHYDYEKLNTVIELLATTTETKLILIATGTHDDLFK